MDSFPQMDNLSQMGNLLQMGNQALVPVSAPHVAIAYPQPPVPLTWTGWGWVPSGVPTPTVGPPVPVHRLPVLTHRLPVQTYRLPAPMYGPPAPMHGFPVPMYGPPAPTHGLPVPTYGPPAPTHGLPVPTYSLPVPTHGLPMPMYRLPVLTLGLPESMYGLPTPLVPMHGLPASLVPMCRLPAPGSASTLWAGASSKDIAHEVQWRCQANRIRNLTRRGLWPVLDDEVVSISLPLPNIYIHLDYLGRLDELEAAWKCQGLCLSGYEDHVLDAHRPMMQLTQAMNLDYKGLVSAESVKSRFCLALSSQQHIPAFGTMVAMHRVIVSAHEWEVHGGMEGNLVALSLPFLVGSAWESSNNLFTFYLRIHIPF